MITLNGITLPSDLEWQDEFNWTPVQQRTARTLTGKLVIEEGDRIKGRPFTLAGAENAAWIRKGTLDQLRALATANNTMDLNYHGEQYQVRFRHRETPIEASQVIRTAAPDQDTRYTFTIRLMEV